MVDVPKKIPPIVQDFPFVFTQWTRAHLANWMDADWSAEARKDGIRIYQIRNGIQVIEEKDPLHPNARFYHVRDALRRQTHAISCRLTPGEVFTYAKAIFKGAIFAELNEQYNPGSESTPATTGYGDW